MRNILKVQKGLANGVKEIQTMICANPKMSHAVAEETMNLIAADGRWNVIAMVVVGDTSAVGVYDRQTVVDMSDIEETVPAIERAPDLVAWQSGKRTPAVVGKLSGMRIEVINTIPISAYPKSAVTGSCQSSQVVRPNAVVVFGLMGIVPDRVVGIVDGIESIALCGNPHDRTVCVVKQGTQRIAAEGISMEAGREVLIIGIEMRTVEAVETFLGSNPQIAPLVTLDGNTVVARQTHVYT